WWSEGVTDYYADLILARAGLNTPADFARRLARSMENFQNDAARMVISPERSSWTTWEDRSGEITIRAASFWKFSIDQNDAARMVISPERSSHVVQEDRSGEITIRAASFWKFSIDNTRSLDD